MGQFTGGTNPWPDSGPGTSTRGFGPPTGVTNPWPVPGPGAHVPSSVTRDGQAFGGNQVPPEALFRGASKEEPLRLPDAAGALANATRAFRAGSYTDGEPPANDETTRALQAIAKSLTSKEDSLAQERGKLSSIGRLEERLVFLLRGCDTLRVTLCPGAVGKELYHALRIAGTQARPQLRRIEFPCNILNRHSYGFAALQLGGKTLATLPDYCLSAGDFPLTSEEDFDNFGGSPDLKLEKKGRYPNTLTSWFRAALRESWAFACIFGEEYYAPLEKAASHLLRLGEQHSYAWSATAVYSAWEELWARFCEEARELDRRVRREMKDETPTFARLKFFALSPGADGQPWLQLPGTFRLDDDAQYFCTDMLPRMQRQLSRACWSGAQKKGGLAPSGGRAAGSDAQAEARSEPGRSSEPAFARPPAEADGARVAGGKTETERSGGRATPEAPSKLLGPSLHPREAARSLDHRPKDAQGQYLCWDHLCHRGCTKGGACPHSHKSVPKWSGLDYSVQLQLLRRGGLKGSKAKTAADVEREFTRIRAEQAAKASAAKQEGIETARATAKAKANSGTGNRDASRAGEQVDHTVEDLRDLHPTDQEGVLGDLLKDAGKEWWVDKDAQGATLERSSVPFNSTPRAEAMREIDADEERLGAYPEGLLGVYLRNRLLRHREDTGTPAQLDDVTRLLEEAADRGGPELAEAAAQLLEERGHTRKAGELPSVRLSPINWDAAIGAGTLFWEGHGQWSMFDYKDQLWLDPTACQTLGFEVTSTEPKQCLLLHVAAAYLSKPGGPLPDEAAVQAQALSWRLGWAEQARIAEDSLGPVPSRLSQAEADVRVFHHDLLYFGHDRDYRTLVAHPLAELADFGLAVLRLDAYLRPSVEVLCGAQYTGNAADTRWVLIHKGHMRLLHPDCPRAPPLGSRELDAVGWEAYLEAAGDAPLLDASTLLQCHVCRPHRQPGSFRTGREAGAFGLQEVRAVSAKAGAVARSEPGSPLVAASAAWSERAGLPPAGAAVPFLLLGDVGVRPAGATVASLRSDVDLHDAIAYLGEGGVDLLWLLPDTLFQGPAHQLWRPALQLAATHLQAGGRCVVEAPLYRRAWSDKFARAQLAGALWHATRQPGPVFGASGPGLTMLRLSFAVPPDLFPVFDAWAAWRRSDGAGGAGASANFDLEEASHTLWKELHLQIPPVRDHLQIPRVQDTEEARAGNSRCGRLFPEGGPSQGPPPSWLPAHLTPEVERATHRYLDAVQDVPYSLEAWNQAVTAGTELLRACGGWHSAVGALRRGWRNRGGDHFAGLFDKRLDDHLPSDLLAWVRKVAQEGVDANYRGTQRARVQATPHPSLKDHVEEARQLIWTDATRGRVLLMSPEPGEESLLEGVVSVPLARVPKYNPDRSVSEKGRVIWDARIVNELCSKDDHFPAAQPKHAEVVRLIVWYQARYPGVRILLAKKDISEAFKWLWVTQEDCRLFGADLPGEDTEDRRGALRAR